MGDAQIMPINYDPLDEGDALNAASLNGRFTAAGGAGQGVNNLAQADLERKALRQEHLPNIITASDFPNGLVKLSPLSVTNSNPYINTLNTLATGAVPVPGYQTFDLGATNGPYGPAAAAATGWRIVADSNVIADAAEITFGPLTATVSTDRIGNYRGILVRMGISLMEISHGGSHGSFGEEGIAVVVGIGWTDQAGNRSVIEKSIRWFNYHSVVKGSLDVFTFIQASDVGNTNQINKIFGVISSASWGATSANYDSPIIRYYNIDIIPIRAGSLE